MRTYWYRLLKTSWGISIQLTAEYQKCSEYSGTNIIKIMDGLYLHIADTKYPESSGFSIEGLNWIIYGLTSISSDIIKKSPFCNDTLIVIHSVIYGMCDYQDEGMVPAIVGWAAEEFDFEPPIINVSYSRDQNRYIYDFGTLEAE